MAETACLATADLGKRRRELAPDTHEAFDAFSRSILAEGSLDEQTKLLIAVAVAHSMQCPPGIEGHTKLAKRKDANSEQTMEAVWVAAEMRACGAFAHSTIARHTLGETPPHNSG